MAYAVAKHIGSLAATLEGGVHAILLTGGLARFRLVVDETTRRVGWIAPVKVYPGEHEMEALYRGVLRVMEKREKILRYPGGEEEAK